MKHTTRGSATRFNLKTFLTVLTLGVFLSFSPAPTQAAILTLNGYTHAVNTGPIQATLDGTPVIAICIDFFKYTPVPSGAITGTLSAVDFSGGGGGPLATLNNFIAAATFQMLIESGYSYLPLGSNPISPVDPDGIVAGQHVVWMAGSVPAFIPNPATAFAAFAGTAVDWYNFAGGVFSNPVNAAAFASSTFASQVMVFTPHNKADQPFLVVTNTPEPGTVAMAGAGLALLGLGNWRRRRQRSA